MPLLHGLHGLRKSRERSFLVLLSRAACFLLSSSPSLANCSASQVELTSST